MYIYIYIYVQLYIYIYGILIHSRTWGELPASKPQTKKGMIAHEFWFGWPLRNVWVEVSWYGDLRVEMSCITIAIDVVLGKLSSIS